MLGPLGLVLRGGITRSLPRVRAQVHPTRHEAGASPRALCSSVLPSSALFYTRPTNTFATYAEVNSASVEE
jgi:hypothetical protein